MATEQEMAQELASKLWDIANTLRGKMDSSKFKNYILGVIFYRYLSEHTEKYMNDLLKNDGMTYEEALANDDYRDTVIGWSLDYLGYYMKPEHMWKSLIAKIKGSDDEDEDTKKDSKDNFSIQDFEVAINETVGSTIGHKGEAAFDKLFDDMNLEDKDLGREVSDRTALIKKVMLKVDDLNFGLEDAKFDVLGTAYMILIGLFQSDAGKKGGEFFTPTCAAELLARLATVGLKECKSVSDCCAGSGSLLLQVQNYVPNRIGHYYAQEDNGSTYNLLRMNLIMHGLSPEEFTTFNDDTIHHDNFGNKKFTVQVDNPPYSAKYDAATSLLEDERYASAGVLPPKSHADMTFVEHMVYHMDDTDGRVAVLVPHGVLFRGGSEEKIRKYFIRDLNRLDAVIGLPADLFHGTPIAVCVLIFKSHRNGDSDNIFFIDASKEYVKIRPKNTMSKDNIDKIVNAYIKREDIPRFAHKATIQEIRDNDYNLNIPRYVDTTDPEEDINLDDILANMTKTQTDIDAQKESLSKDFADLGITLPWE